MPEIHIHNVKTVGNRIINQVNVSRDLQGLFNSSTMIVEYDDKIYADNSILNIPLTATILPLAWLSGSDVYVETLDKAFLESMNNLKSYFKDVYPLIPFTTNINVDELVENTIDVKDTQRRAGLLFSGGIDSFHSLISNMDLKPQLIMHWGIERTPYPIHREYWEKVKHTYEIFAEKYDTRLHLTKTNALEILHERKIEHKYYKELFYGGLWERLQLSLVVLSLAAPLSVNRFDRLLIAGSAWPISIETQAEYRPYSARPEVDEKITWADLNVFHDGFIEKYKKIRELAEYMKNNELIFRVCMNRKDTSGELNCSYCMKCSRTIAQLLQAEIDPNRCGFKVEDNSQLNRFMESLQRSGLISFGVNAKKIIPERIDYDRYGSKEFFEWLRNFNEEEKEEELFLRDFYNNLPFPAAKILNEVYKLLGVNIHFGNPKLPLDKIQELLSERNIDKPEKNEG